jgi:hypothetical protein
MCCIYCGNVIKKIIIDDIEFCSVMCLTSYIIRFDNKFTQTHYNVLNGLSEPDLSNLLLPIL